MPLLAACAIRVAHHREVENYGALPGRQMCRSALRGSAAIGANRLDRRRRGRLKLGPELAQQAEERRGRAERAAGVAPAHGDDRTARRLTAGDADDAEAA